jgi:hypothetical protein
MVRIFAAAAVLAAAAPAVASQRAGLGPALSTAAVALSDKPDLVPRIPIDPHSDDNLVPEYVDAYSWEKRGALLYRFDTVIWNQGGALDLYRDPVTGHAMQAIWSGGVPNVQPDPNSPPTSAQALLEDRTSTGAHFIYPGVPGHNHWHFDGAAHYELLGTGPPRRSVDKVGFCMNDSYGPSNGKFFPYGYKGSGSGSWCQERNPLATFVRMGISKDHGDLYWSMVPSQWVDVTGLDAGRVTIRATVNPLGYIDESNRANNVLDVVRTLPGTIAAPLAATVPPRASVIRLAGTVLAAKVPARTSDDCEVDRLSRACLVFASAAGPLSFRIVDTPDHGTAAITGQSGLSANVTYTPAPGYSGPDSFTYTTADARGLTSAPSRVDVSVESSAPAVAETVHGTDFDDTLAMLDGNDTIAGHGGNDRLNGGPGNDILSGDGGNDRIVGGPGLDRIDGGTGNDLILARDGEVDTIRCGPGKDRVIADRNDRVARDC